MIIRLIGFLTVAVCSAMLITVVAQTYGGIFLFIFLRDQFLEIFVTLVGLDIAALTFFLGQILAVEAQLGDGKTFYRVKKELRDNCLILIFSLLTAFLFLVFLPDVHSTELWRIETVIAIGALSSFAFALFATWDILVAVFTLSGFSKTD